MATKQASKSWVICPQPNPQARLRLFCFHYAGGGALSFRDWPNNLPSSVEVCLIELPGRGIRFGEVAFTSMAPLVQAIADALLPYLDKPFAFFGHSMGGLVSFELARILRRNCRLNLTHLFVSGHRAPHLPDPDLPIYNLPDSEFLDELRKFEGTPPEVLENTELMQLLLPTLKADFTVVETYTYINEPPLNISITAFGGKQDRETNYDQLNAWRQQTNEAFSLHMLPGNHFFLNSSQAILLTLLSKKLLRLVSEIE